MAAGAQIDPTTGERIPVQGAAPQIDPATGERIVPRGTISQSSPPDTRNQLQKDFDTSTATSPSDSLFRTGLKSTIGGILQPFAHPVKTLQSASHLLDPMGPGSENPVQGMASGVHKDYEDGGLPYAATKLGGNLTGGAILGEAGGAVMGPLRAAGAPLERGGLGVINHALDVTPKMMKYGQNPARGLVDEGIAPSMSKFSLGNKLDKALPIAGQRVGHAVEGTTSRIPEDDIAQSIEWPINEGRSIIEGPGGANRSAAPLESLRASMAERAPGATRPIYRADDPFQPTQPFDPTGTIHNAPRLSGTADASAADLWRSIQNIDRNTRFNPDPEVEGVNEVRRDIRGGLRGNLENAVPGLKPLSQRYGDLRTVSDALERTAGRGGPLKGLKDVFSFPAETTGGTALVKGGRMLQRIPPPDPLLKYIPGMVPLMSRKENQ